MYYSVHKYILLSMKYISDQALKYVRLPTKISQIVFQNILNCILKYFRKTWDKENTFK